MILYLSKVTIILYDIIHYTGPDYDPGGPDANIIGGPFIAVAKLK